MQSIVGRRRRQQRRLGQAGEQKPHPAQVEERVVPRERGRQHRSGFGCDQGPIGDDHHEGQLVAQGQLGCRGAFVDHRCRNKSSENTRCRVLGMTVLRGGDGERVVSPGRSSGRGRQRGRRTEATRDRDLRAHRHCDAVVAEDGRGHAHGEMRCVVTEAGALSFAVDAQRWCGLHFHLDIAIQRDGKCVEAGP